MMRTLSLIVLSLLGVSVTSAFLSALWMRDRTITQSEAPSYPAIAVQDQLRSAQPEPHLKQRVTQLEHAIAPQSPQAAVEAWAHSVQTRNGGLQFAILSSELRQVHQTTYEESAWMTGASSPWIESYRVIEEIQEAADLWHFEIEYKLMTSTGSAGTTTQHIEVRQFPTTSNRIEGWYITNFSSSPNTSPDPSS